MMPLGTTLARPLADGLKDGGNKDGELEVTDSDARGSKGARDRVGGPAMPLDPNH